MEKSTNIPYVKKYDAMGEILNPIGNGYFHHGDNREKRRINLPTHKFMGCGKSFPLTVVGNQKFNRHIQCIFLKDGTIKLIYHYLPV
jgi:hypothetical protein